MTWHSKNKTFETKKVLRVNDTVWETLLFKKVTDKNNLSSNTTRQILKGNTCEETSVHRQDIKEQ